MSNALNNYYDTDFTPPKCQRAERLAVTAKEHGFESTVEYNHARSGGDSYIDVQLTGTWSEFDDDNHQTGWHIGFALRWYRSGNRWSLGHLGRDNGPVVGGVAMPFDDEDREVNFTLVSVRDLERTLEDPQSVIEWLDGRLT